MKVARIHKYSGPTAVQVDDIEVLQSEPGEVRIRVGAAGINNSDLQTTYGTYRGYGYQGLPQILGQEAAGEVDAVGLGVKEFVPGMRVVRHVRGAFGSMAIGRANELLPLADEVSFTLAASLPIAYMTAGMALIHKAKVEDGEWVLVHPGNRCVIAMDLMGLGESDKPPRIYSVADYAKTIIALWDELGIKKSSILSNVTGGYIAGEVAAAYPERVDKLILSNVIGFDVEEQQKISKRYSQGFQVQEDGSHLMKRWLARVNYLGKGELNHRCVLDDLKCFGSPVYPGLAVANYCLSAPERFGLIKCPTLNLSGEKAVEALEKFGLAKAENQFWLPKAIPHSQIVELEDGTLWMMNQRSEEVSQIIRDFLKQKG